MSAHKTYRGRDVEALLPQIRAELGDDAVVLRSREARVGGVGGFFSQRVFEIDVASAAMLMEAGEPMPEAFAETAMPEPATAPGSPTGGIDVTEDALAAFPDLLRDAVEADVPGDWGQLIAYEPIVSPFPDPVVMPAPAPRRRSTDVVAGPAEAPVLEAALTRRGMSLDLAAELVGETVDHLLPFASERALRPLLAGQIARRIPVTPTRGRGGFVAGFVGPGGSGKTRCVARLALAYASRGAGRVAVVTLRPKDGGDELRSLLGASGVPVVALDDPAIAARRIAGLSADIVVLVDTPGVSPRAEAELRQLGSELRQLQLDECHLTLPATTGPHAAAELIAGTRALGVDALALTHADETEHYGTAVEAAIASGLPLSYIGRGADVRGGLVPVEAQELAQALVAA